MIFYLFNKHFLFFFVVLSVYVQKPHLIYKERLKFVQADIILIELIWRYVLHMQYASACPDMIALGGLSEGGLSECDLSEDGLPGADY